MGRGERGGGMRDGGREVEGGEGGGRRRLPLAVGLYEY